MSNEVLARLGSSAEIVRIFLGHVPHEAKSRLHWLLELLTAICLHVVAFVSMTFKDLTDD
jgi:hypothetical protein